MLEPQLIAYALLRRELLLLVTRILDPELSLQGALSGNQQAVIVTAFDGRPPSIYLHHG
jgi:hypothetical protein